MTTLFLKRVNAKAAGSSMFAVLHQVLSKKSVASFTVSFACILRSWTFASEQICFLSYGLKMTRIHAKSISAQVVDLTVSWYLALMNFVRNSVSPIHGPSGFLFNADFSIPKRVLSMPQPASSSFLDPFEKSSFKTAAHVGDIHDLKSQAMKKGMPVCANEIG